MGARYTTSMQLRRGCLGACTLRGTIIPLVLDRRVVAMRRGRAMLDCRGSQP